MSSQDIAIKHFEERTTIRKSKLKSALVDQIRSSKRPMARAKELLRQHGEKDVTVSFSQFSKDIVARWPYDPVFDRRVKEAKAKCLAGEWTIEEHDKLVGILKAAWNPWSKDDTQ